MLQRGAWRTWRKRILVIGSGARAGWATCAGTAFFGTFLICIQVPNVYGTDQYVGAALWGFASVLLELGLQRLPCVCGCSLSGRGAGHFRSHGSEWRQVRQIRGTSRSGCLPSSAAAAAWVMSGRLSVTRRSRARR